ncbi:mitochondrial substrate carrier family protein [Tieghemostelium lacteum]|uniref:Mitochondrial substrate carrier family protein n=1 Tax=Tieghemostelium lacteum TaxID=361077 RepID=A0A151ZBF3_TIELA|nr:mitochondrial substrate carrier family protein [Tieghemostelium lacteum]|eukprot:KYQ91268.1 mitochondrial substrate carrier family protein [Tieghemostelium lacteum]
MISSSTSNSTEHTVKKQMIASIIGGMVTALTVTPLDVVKTRLQTSTKSKIGGTVDTLIKITRTEGIHTLWRGLGPSLLMTIPSSTIYFTTYEHLKDYMYKLTDGDNINRNIENTTHSRFTVPLLAGSLARIISATFTSPIELIRTNSQGVVQKDPFNSVRLIRQIYTNVGLTGLWRGLIPTLIRDVPFSAFYWSGYEITKEILMKQRSHLYQYPYNSRNPTPFFVNFLSGAISGTFAAIITTPIDVIKTRIQMSVQQEQILHQSPNNQQSNSSNNSKSFSSSPTQNLKMIIEKEGWKGLTKGMVPRVAKVSPACAIMVSTYEWVKSVHF